MREAFRDMLQELRASNRERPRPKGLAHRVRSNSAPTGRSLAAAEEAADAAEEADLGGCG